MKYVIVLFVSISTLLLSGCFAVQSVKVKTHSPSVSTSLYFSDHDRSRIRGYYLYNKPHKKHLPPGHRKAYKKRFQLHRPLPPGLSYHRLPMDLERRLPPLPSGYVRVIVGSDIVIMNANTRIIYDAIWELY